MWRLRLRSHVQDLTWILAQSLHWNLPQLMTSCLQCKWFGFLQSRSHALEISWHLSPNHLDDNRAHPLTDPRCMFVTFASQIQDFCSGLFACGNSGTCDRALGTYVLWDWRDCMIQAQSWAGLCLLMPCCPYRLSGRSGVSHCCNKETYGNTSHVFSKVCQLGNTWCIRSRFLWYT